MEAPLLDHRTALAALSAERKATLAEKSNAKGLRHLTLHLGAILALGTPIALGWPGWPVFLLPLGLAQVFLFTLSHECTHKTPFRTPWLNDLVGHVVSLPLLLPFTWFRYFHFAHHKYTNDPDRDPELASPRPDSWPRFWLYLSGWGYWSGLARVLWRNAFGEIAAPYLPASLHQRVRREARLMLLAYGLLALTLFWGPLLIWLWLVPVLLGQPALRLYLLAEHGHCPPVANMLANTRTTLTNRFVRALAWNMPYHAEHHAAPYVPFHRLPDLHRDLAPHLRQTADGYCRFTQDYTARLT